MTTNCEECGVEVDDDMVDGYLACGADGLCPDCLDYHECEG